MMEHLNDSELRNLYTECIKSPAVGVWENKYVLEQYNKVFYEDDGYLHFWMVKKLRERVMEEMAIRFFNQQ